MAMEVGMTTTRIALWGAPATGKTTLAKALSENLGLELLTEYATEWLNQYGIPLWESSTRFQQGIFRVQRAREADSSKGVVSDSPSGLGFFYLTQHPKWSGVTTDAERCRVVDGVAYYTHHFYLPSGVFPYESTAIRPDAQSSAQLDERLRAFLGSYSVPYTELKRSSVEGRLLEIQWHIREHYRGSTIS